MPIRARDFLSAIGLVFVLTITAWILVRLPGVSYLGGLALALLLGLGWKAFRGVPESWSAGLGFASKRLLRWGIILLGVRLNLALILDAGLKILVIDLTVVIVGLCGISWLGRKFGLDPIMAMLIAVGSSICGGSAVAATAPVMGAREHEVALVIPLCSLVGTVVMIGYTVLQHAVGFSPEVYGLLVGSTLHEVAHVVAAVTPFPEAVDLGTVTKLTRVLLLVPVIVVLGWIYARNRKQGAASEDQIEKPVPKPWFVLGFIIVGAVNTLAWHYLPEQRSAIIRADQGILKGAAFLMAMAMVAMGLQTDFARLRGNGLRALGTAVFGWMLIASFAIAEIWWLSR